jgi:enterochelin esterase family protein
VGERSVHAGRAASFALLDRHRRLTGVRLVQEIGLAGPLEFERAGGMWRLTVDLPDVHRMEYLFEISDRAGRRTTIPDPANPRRARGAFGDKSVLELVGYAEPEWLSGTPVDGDTTSMLVDADELDDEVEVAVWAPDALDAGTPAPLLVVHDGPEYARLGDFLHYVGVCIGTGQLPALRAALVSPGDRDAWYSANPAYARVLGEQVLPAVAEVAPSTVRIGIGASLGALAMLHAHRTAAAPLDGLLLQSGSFFTPKLDPQESGFSGFAAVTEFVAATHAARLDELAVPAVLTCGTVEENLANNKSMAETLRRLGYPTRMVVVPDAHNYTAWRDALHPQLTDLVTDVVGARAA